MGITISGFNDIDFGAVVDAIVTSESQPLTNLQTKKTSLDTQNSAFGTLATKLTALQTAFDSLSTNSSLAGLTANSSDAGVAVSAGTGTVEGSYDVIVTALARRQVTTSSQTYGSADAVVATGGSLVLRDGTGNDTTINVTGSMKLSELATAINANINAPVSASVVQTTPGVYNLVLTGKSTGAANGFSINSSGLTGGVGVTFTNSGGGAFAGDSVADNTQNARNAAFSVNGLAVSSASNVVTDAVAGATLTLQKEDPLKTISVSVARDTSTGKAKLTSLMAAYNDFMAFLDAQRTTDIAGRPSISRDPLIRSLRDNFRSTFMGQYSSSGTTMSRLAEVGLGFDRSGKMVLDSTIYDATVKEKPADVQKLFSTGGTAGTGAFGAMKSLIQSYTNSGGLVSDLRDRLTASAKSMTARIDALTAQIEQRRQSLLKEYAAADLMMTNLKSQSSSLSTLSSVYRLF